MRSFITLAAFVGAVASSASAQQHLAWSDVFARSERSTSYEPHPQDPACFGFGRQPDSVALTVAPLGQVEYWTPAGWRPAGSGWAVDTSYAALRRVDCVEGGDPRYATVERDHHSLRLMVFPLPGDPVDILRGRAKDGTLSPLKKATFRNGIVALVSAATFQDSLAAAAKAEQREQARRDAEEERARQREIAVHRKALLARGWSPELVDAILAGKVAIGMTPAMVTEALGEPDHINVTVSEYDGRTEQWVYGFSTYIYFRRGHVTSMQFSR
jgi:hypothetical protein